jgi:hypothetical protein
MKKSSLIQKINKKLTKGKLFNPWGLLEGIHVPISVLKSKGKLTNTAKLLLGVLFHYSGKDGLAFPSRKRLATDLDVSLRTLDRAIKNLKDEELIYTYQKNERSPSIYFFVENSDYYKKDSINTDKIGGTDKNDSRGTDKNDSRGTDKNGKHKEYNKERDQERKRKIFLKKNCKTSEKRNKGELRSQADAYVPLQKIGLNGKSISRKHLPKIKIVPNPLKRFNFPDPVFEILNHWHLAKGKVPKDPNRRKTADQISNQIQELLLPGNNPYTPVLKEKEFDFRQKKWTIQEIKDTIDYYTKELCRTIEDMYFSQFIIHRNLPGMKTKTLKDYSPLVETYKLLPQQLSYLAKKLKNNFTSNFPEIHFYDKTFINIASFLEEKLNQYKSYQPYSGIYFEERFIDEIFFIYMTKKVKPKGTYEELKYMANPQNLREFILWCIDLNLIKGRTDKEIKNYKKEIKKEYKNQIKAYQNEINSGKADSKWSQEKWEYFEFLKEKVEC